MSDRFWARVAEAVGAASGTPFAARERRAVGGGCINEAVLITDGARRYFVKLNGADREEMFAAEAEGLLELAAAEAIRVPHPLCWGSAEGRAYLVLEALHLGGASGRDAQARFGERLAALHRHRAARFGWHRDNTIGATHQPNDPEGEWLRFYRERRLGFQLALAAERGLARLRDPGERLLEVLPCFFAGHAPEPSLLHGDLWSGNYAFDEGGEPVLFDPAVYYGDREADIAMTELFGGFGTEFYAAYRAAWPLDPGYTVRRTLYNLYHVLNHANLFGGGYASQAQTMMHQLLSEAR